MTTDEKILSKIRNLLDLANNNSNENEAMAAALKAQELMAKYNIDSSAIDTDEVDKELFHAWFKDNGKHEMKTWKVTLSQIIARNFCCRLYFSGSSVVFYGYKKDAQIAVEVFRFLYESGNKFAIRYYTKLKKEGKNTKGIMNTYLQGFCAGIREVLDRQCTALMIVIPKEVNESFDEMTANWKTKKTHINYSGDVAAYQQGKIDGKETATAKGIED